MKLYYIANARIPSEKAHGIQIAKMCEAFIENGVNITLVVPRRKTDPRSVRQYYGLRVEVPVVRLWAIDWYNKGGIGYAISSFSFMFSYCLFVLHRKIVGGKFTLYTVDMDNYSSSALAFLGLPLFSEMHGAKLRTLAQRALFKQVSGIIAINKIIKEELHKKFSVPLDDILVEPNSVDFNNFDASISSAKARDKLFLPKNKKIITYVGRFYDWKGLGILARTAAYLGPDILMYIVGGTKEEYIRITKERKIPGNIVFVGGKDFSEIPLWLAASDALLVLGSKLDTQSYYYTSPMKIFEYMAMRRPIIASETPALKQIFNNEEVFFYEPDNEKDCAKIIKSVFLDQANADIKASNAYAKSKNYTWRMRSRRIIDFIEKSVHSEKT